MKQLSKKDLFLLTGIWALGFPGFLTACPAGASASIREVVHCGCDAKRVKLSIRLPADTGLRATDTTPAAFTVPALARNVTAGMNEMALRACCEKLASEKRRIYYLNNRRGKVALRLKGIYTRGDAVFLQVFLRNYSNIDYVIDKIGFYVADQRPDSKKEIRQKEILPLYAYGNTRIIRGKDRELCIFALPRFTLPQGKRLVISVLENNGGRHLQLFTDNYTLLKARLI